MENDEYNNELNIFKIKENNQIDFVRHIWIGLQYMS